MPYYTELNKMNASKRKRVAMNILRLREMFAEGHGLPGDKEYVAPIPDRTLNDHLIVGTWNIREFDSQAYGLRDIEPMMYISEIISRFDIVAIQEVRRDTRILDRLRRLLGYHWDYIVTDETVGKFGNKERLAVFFDSRKVKFTGVVGEIVLPEVDGAPVSQFARTPLMVGFQSGWFKFSLCTAHIIFGKGGADSEKRVREIDLLARHLKDQMLKYRKLADQGKIQNSEYENIILLGDFNIFSTDDATYKAMIDNGWDVCEGLFGVKTNTGRIKRSFDQIAYRNDAKNVEATGRCGVFDYFRIIYREEDHKHYRTALKKMQTYADYSEEDKRQKYYRTYWRTHQMSDHLPLWVELNINFSREYLERRVPELCEDNT